MSIVTAGYVLSSTWYDVVNMRWGVDQLDAVPGNPYTHTITFPPSVVSATTSLQSYMISPYAGESSGGLGGGLWSGIEDYESESQGLSGYSSTPRFPGFPPQVPVGEGLWPAVFGTDLTSVTFFYLLFAMPGTSADFVGYVYFWEHAPIRIRPIPMPGGLGRSGKGGRGSGAPAGRGEGRQLAAASERIGVLYDSKGGRIVQVHRVTALSGGKMLDERSFEKRMFESAKRRGAVTSKLRFTLVPPETFDVTTYYKVDTKSGRLLAVKKG